MKKKFRIITILMISLLLVLLLGQWIRDDGRKLGQQKKMVKATMIPKETHNAENQSEKRKIKSLAPAKTQGKKVRILIRTSHYKGIYHDSVRLKIPSYTVMKWGKHNKYFRKAKQIEFNGNSFKKYGKKVSIVPKKNGTITVSSIQRQGGIPSYRGGIDIWKTKYGLLVINELPLEQYLYAVLPSEMPSESGMEALKAQAVCARSYTCQQLKQKTYKKYHADLEDNENCQVYHNFPETKRARKAVQDTSGIVMKSDGKIVSAFYYATSWGNSASAKEALGKQEDEPYLKAKSLAVLPSNLSEKDIVQCMKNSQNIDYSSETSFQKFLLNPSMKTYDSDSDWYRWHVSLSAKKLEKRLPGLLELAWRTDPTTVRCKRGNGKYKSMRPTFVGALQDIKIGKRNKSGLLSSIIIKGSKHTYRVKGQYAIRTVLSPLGETIDKANGTQVTGMELLPSAAFCLKREYTEAGLQFYVYGGGFGHGIGMSQTGAENMANRGYAYHDILKMFYSDIMLGRCHS